MAELPKVIDLNVGGCYLTTKLSTLTKYPDSMLAAMFSGRHVIDQDKDGRYVIDCDSKIFGHILEFLRFGKLPPSGVAEEVLPYSEYFGLQDLSDGLRTRKVPELINLNVGGKYFTTKLATLTKYPKSTLASMFSEGHAVLQDGRYVIDCDSKIFGHILEFLRFGKLPPSDVAEAVLRYSEYFGLQVMSDGLRKLANGQVPEMINLNVGGMFFTTQLSTLTKYPKSTLASMFSKGPHSKGHAVLQDGRYVIYCDGTIFKHILEFLRFEAMPPKKFYKEVHRYAKHFKIKVLREGIKDKWSDSSD